VQVHGGQQIHHVGGLAQRNPVELHIGAGGEVGAVLGQIGRAQLALAFQSLFEDFGLGLVVLAGHLGQHADLGRVDFAVGHGHAQHGGIALHIPAVLQAQRAEVVFRELACLPALELVTELVGALLDRRFVEIGVLIHVFSSSVERMPCRWHCTDCWSEL
jgi:hypothetical protein